MRSYLILAILTLVLAFTGCDKETIGNADLQGSWELRHVKGVQIAGAPSGFPPGNGHIVKFEDNTFEIYDKDQLLLSTTFRIEPDEEEIDGTKFSHKLVYQELGHESTRYIKISGNTLLISTGTIAADGSTATYEKL